MTYTIHTPSVNYASYLSQNINKKARYTKLLNTGQSQPITTRNKGTKEEN